VTRIAHLSDLHFGAVSQRTLERLAAKVAEISPDIVVVTGDLTQAGRRSEFKAAAEFLHSLSRPLVAIPGNHDVPVYHLPRRFFAPWRLFREHIGRLARTYAECERVAIIGVNSARRAQPRFNWSYGRLRRRDIAAAAQKAKKVSEGRLVFVAVHHPFQPGVGSVGAVTVGRAREAIAAFAEAGVAGVMTGHVHVTSVAPIPPDDALLSIQAGTSASTRLRHEAASFLQIDCKALTEVAIKQFVETEEGFLDAANHNFVREERRWRPAV
jgi:3',5'-cyclic AMP phosphodiesterase CpdA